MNPAGAPRADGDVSGSCTANFSSDTDVTLTATADPGSTFTLWTDPASGEDFDYEQTQGFAAGPVSSPTISLNVDSGRELAVFAAFNATQ